MELLNVVFLPCCSSKPTINTSTGIFKTPIAGTYLFTFTGLKTNSLNDSLVQLQKNGVTIAASFAPGLPNVIVHPPIHVLVKLAVNDTVNLFLAYGTLYDDTSYFTRFTGFLVLRN